MPSLQDGLNTFSTQEFDLPTVDEDLMSAIGAINDEISAQGDESASASEIDIAALAQKVYALLKKELRIESERRGQSSSW